jgi:murein DD-endopeptidase MepM/ murein hydrolase activator NlpD
MHRPKDQLSKLRPRWSRFEIKIAAAGIVSVVGGSDFDDYGYRVTIDYGNGITNTYAHLSTITAVRRFGRPA